MDTDKEKPEISRKRSDKSRRCDEPVCPVCGEKLLAEKCKLVCRSASCTYRIIYNCAEF